MSRIAPNGYSDRVRYILQHEESGNLTINEPIGWRDDDNEFVRHQRYHGIWTAMTNALQFTENGAEYINNIYFTYGINAKIRLSKDERNPTTDIFERVYDGYLDMETWEYKERIVSVKFNSSNLFKTIKSKESSKVEITRLDTLSGKGLDPLKTVRVPLNGREILLKSLLEVLEVNDSTTVWRMNFSDTNRRYGVLAIPTTVTYKSDTHIFSVDPDAFSIFGGTTPDTGQVEQLFYAVNDRPKTLNLKIQVEFLKTIERVDDTKNEFMQLDIAVYNGGTDYEINRRETIKQIPIPNGQFFAEFEYALELEEGESASLQIYGGADFGGILGSDGDFSFNFSNIQASIDIQENSFFDATTCQAVLPYELTDRLLNIITDRDDVLSSEALGRKDTTPQYEEEGFASVTAMTSGFWIRGFDDEDLIVDEDGEATSMYKPPSISFKDWVSSYFAVWNLGMGIEKQGFKEVARIEDLGYFYNRNVLIHCGTKNADGTFTYPQVNKVKRSIDVKNYSSGFEIGYDKWEEYEEAMGLDEYNALSTFTTSINVLENTNRDAVSKVRADSYGIEFARRQQERIAPTEDTNYDKHNFLLDCKKLNTSPEPIFQIRLWQDDFASSPTGIFSPQTAFNLRLSPFNMILRTGAFIQAGLTKYPTEYLRYASSTGNSKMTTELDEAKYPLIGGTPYSENGNIQNKDLQRAKYVPEFVEFEFEVDFDLLQQVQGKTVVLGKEITNFYGLVQFRNENNVIEKGFLLNLKPNGTGKWKLLKYNNQ